MIDKWEHLSSVRVVDNVMIEGVYFDFEPNIDSKFNRKSFRHSFLLRVVKISTLYRTVWFLARIQNNFIRTNFVMLFRC